MGKIENNTQRDDSDIQVIFSQQCDGGNSSSNFVEIKSIEEDSTESKDPNAECNLVDLECDSQMLNILQVKITANSRNSNRNL